MTLQAILLIRELLLLTIKLRPWTDVVSQNSFMGSSNIMTPKKNKKSHKYITIIETLTLVVFTI